MTQYIDKSAVMEEIKKRRDKNKLNKLNLAAAFEDNYLLSFLDTIEVKEGLTWQDIKLMSEIGENFMNSNESDNLSEEEYYTEILNRFKNDRRR